MGCTNSVKVSKTSCSNIETDQPTLTIKLGPQMDLTENEKRIVKSTWHHMTKDISENGLRVFLRIFETCPETKELFHVENSQHIELTRNQVIRGHGARFISAIWAAVNCLDESGDKQEKLREVLFVLGQQHKDYSGFKAEYSEIFYDALMWQWELCIGDNFTSEVSDTWSHVFVYMMENLKEGYFS
ncbi:globin C, coelomic-like [Mercenaria mercenaria]|uniref:globin C, coelomic-like n=1 Tax=Mercenaria mercenaria TaxID=6596 RepID=UPI00234EEE2F|nr:globin C, coelomic-like [Mercenaria mercenaria]